MLEGLLLGMVVVGAEEGWVFIRHEYGPEEHVLRAELDALRAAGLVGPDACGSGRRLAVEVFVSPGGYILGEETALLECMEGHRGEPRNKPPFPGNYGLYGQPTLINSVETFADVPVIVQRGAQWWTDQGVGDSVGLKFFAVSGHVERPGVYCVPMGTTVRELLELAGGVERRPGGRRGAAGRGVVELHRAGQAGRAAGLRHRGGGRLDARLRRDGRDGRGHRPARRGDQRAAVLPRRVVRQVRAVPGRLDQGARDPARRRSSPGRELDDDRRAHVVRLEEVMRRTSICGLGQVALGPVVERARADKGGAAARDAAPAGRRRGPAGPVTAREFFTARTVGEALAGFRPGAPHAGRDGRRWPRRCAGCRPAE